MLKALETNIEEDLFFLRDYLFSRNIDHRISESGGRQTLWVFRLEHVGEANAADHELGIACVVVCHEHHWWHIALKESVHLYYYYHHVYI